MSIDPPGDATTETSGKGSGKDYRVAGAGRQGPDGDESPPGSRLGGANLLGGDDAERSQYRQQQELLHGPTLPDP
jgi:hypothetical protein